MYPRILSAINNKVKRPQKVPLFIFFIPKIFWHYSRLAPAVRRELHFRYGYLLSQGPKGPVKVDILVYAANFSCFIASAIIIVTVSATNDRLLHTIKHMPQVAAVVVITANAKGFFRCNRRTFGITKCQGLFGKGLLFCFSQCNLPSKSTRSEYLYLFVGQWGVIAVAVSNHFLTSFPACSALSMFFRFPAW